MRTPADALRAEQITRLRKQGMSEADAIKAAHKADKADKAAGPALADTTFGSVPPTVAPVEPGGSDDGEPGASPDASLEDPPDQRLSRSFIIYTKDFSGLGWAKKLTEEGETVTLAVDNPEKDAKDRTLFDKVGSGWLDVRPIAEVVAQHKGDDSVYHIFAENCFIEVAEKLIQSGARVFGTSTLSERMEHDRAYAVGVAEEAGLGSPATEACATIEEGLAFLDAHASTAYVFKPDSSKFNHLTFVPARRGDPDANRELATYLEHVADNPGPYILQERLPKDDALEVNAEAWFYEGEPFLATVNFELKRKDTGDLGEMAGCAGDFMMVVPLDCPLIQQTIGLTFPFYKAESYTGFGDVNVIFTPDGVPHFLENTCRMGYNAHISMFLGLLKGSLGDLLADFCDGVVVDMPSRFDAGVAGSLTVFLDHPRAGLPLHLDEGVVEQFYPFDGYKAEDVLLLTGYSNEVGVLVQKGATIEAAAAALYSRMSNEAVSVPDGYWRTDLGDSDYPNAPAKRYAELKRRKLL